MYLIDPSTKLQSVTLTLVVVTFIAALIAAGLEIAGVTKGTSILLELFVGNLSVYVGRRISWGGKSYAADPATTTNNGDSK